MSKSANAIYLPVFGGVALALGLGYGLANRSYGTDRIESLEDRLGQVEARAAEVAADAEAKGAAVESVSAEAAAAAARAAELEEKIASIQAQAARAVSTVAPVAPPDGRFGLGRAAHPDEIAAWDIDVRPNGQGLPEGRGDVWTGDEVFADYCASCHGDFAEGVDNWPVLAGGFDTLGDKDPVKTVGSYWPYLSTVWDYVHRSMPFGGAQTLTDDEVYAIVAYILYSNDLVDEDFELSHENFLDVEMYNTGGFIVDDRAETEYPIWRTEPCMEGCKEGVEITMRASVLDLTPDDGSDDEAMAPMSHDTGTLVASVEPEAEPPAEVLSVDPEMVAAGEKVFKKCKSCHAIGDGAKNKSGPQLTGIMGRTFGGAEGFKYSNVFQSAAEAGRVWDDAEMAAFLAKPKDHMKGTRMSFAGLKKEADRTAIIAYLRSFGG